MWRFHLTAFVTWVLLCVVPLTLAQLNCTDAIAAALQSTDRACFGLERNKVCYGNFVIQASARAEAIDFNFENVGDVADLANVASLRMSAFNVDDQTWGVGVMQVQANLPDALPAQNVTMLIFGNVGIANAAPTPIELTMTTTAQVQVYLDPDVATSSIATLPAGQTVIATGRSSDNLWIRLQLAGVGSGSVWVSSGFLSTSGDLTTLPTVEAGEPVYQPMQAFLFRSDVGAGACDQVPNDGIVIQTPEGMGQIDLLINEVAVRLGSTAYLWTANSALYINVLEGRGEISAGGSTQSVPAGSYSRIPLGANGLASGIPDIALPYDLSVVDVAPLRILPEVVFPASPISAPDDTAPITTPESAASYQPTPWVTPTWGSVYVPNSQPYPMPYGPYPMPYPQQPYPSGSYCTSFIGCGYIPSTGYYGFPLTGTTTQTSTTTSTVPYGGQQQPPYGGSQNPFFGP